MTVLLAGVLIVGLVTQVVLLERAESFGTLTRKDVAEIRQVVFRDGLDIGWKYVLPDLSWTSIRRFPMLARIKLTTGIRDLIPEADGSVTVRISGPIFEGVRFRLEKRDRGWTRLPPPTVGCVQVL